MSKRTDFRTMIEKPPDDLLSDQRCSYSSNKEFDAVLRLMGELHDKKAHDYAKDANRYSNFESAAEVADITPERVFLVMIGIKIARIRELLSGKEPLNESLDDTILDLAVYASIWRAYRVEQEKVTTLTPPPHSKI